MHISIHGLWISFLGTGLVPAQDWGMGTPVKVDEPFWGLGGVKLTLD